MLFVESEEDSFQSRSLGYCFFVVLVVLVWDKHGFIRRPGWAPSRLQGWRISVKQVFNKSTKVQTKTNHPDKSLQYFSTRLIPIHQLLDFMMAAAGGSRRDVARASAARPSGSTCEIPMPPPSTGMSDTLPPSIIAGVPEAEAGPEVARNPAPAALPVGSIERMGHTIQHLQSQNEVLRNTVETLSASVATMAAAAVAATSTRASSSSTGPGVKINLQWRHMTSPQHEV